MNNQLITPTVETTKVSTLLNGRGHAFLKRNQLKSIPMPEATKTYKPVSHLKLINKVEKIVLSEKPFLKVVSERHNLSAQGQMLETTLTMQDTRKDFSEFTDDTIMPSVIIRNSYNKWTPVTIGAAANVLVCLNGMMADSGFFYSRKHTENASDDITAFSMGTADLLMKQVETFEKQIAELKGIEISQERGYEILGNLYGHKVLNATANNVAFTDWITPRHDVFGEKNMWSLYNCANEGLKKKDNYSRTQAHCQLHHYMTKGFDAPYKNEFKKVPEGFSATGYKLYEA